MPDEPVKFTAAPSDEDRAAHEAALGRRVEAAMQQVQVQADAAQIELARPELEWNLWAIGPATWPSYGGGPTKVVRVGEWFYLDVIVWLNAFPPYPGIPSACERISTTACEVRIKLCSMDLCKVAQGPNDLNETVALDLVPRQCYYVRSFFWQAQPGWEGLYEINIAAWILGCKGHTTPYAGFVTRVYDITSDIFYPWPPGQPPRWEFDIPIKFMITS